MKKAGVILLLLIYGSTTMGATINLHYCMDEFVGWSLMNNRDKNCGKCGMEEKNKDGCCKDEQKHFKLKIDHQKADVSQYITLVNIPGLFSFPYDFVFHSVNDISETFPTSHAPPDIGHTRLHILFSVFLI